MIETNKPKKITGYELALSCVGGNESVLARIVGISPQGVNQWKKKGVIPPKSAKILEKKLGISRKLLNPDFFSQVDMSYESMETVINSGLEDIYLVDVLKALVFVQNPETGSGVASVAICSRLSRLEKDLTARTLTHLQSLGYITIDSGSEECFFFKLHLDRLPKRGEVLHQ